MEDAAKRREELKNKRLREGSEKFENHIERLGGVVDKETASQYGDTEKLLCIKYKDGEGFPSFQFNGNEIIKGLPEVLEALGSFSDTTKISILTCTSLSVNSPTDTILDSLKTGDTQKLKDILFHVKRLGNVKCIF